MDETVSSRERIDQITQQLDRHISLLRGLYENPEVTELELHIFDQTSQLLIDKLQRNSDWNSVVAKLPTGARSIISRDYQRSLIEFLTDVRLQISTGVLAGIKPKTLEELQELYSEHTTKLAAATEAEQTWKDKFEGQVKAYGEKRLEAMRATSSDEVPALKKGGSHERIATQFYRAAKEEVQANKKGVKKPSTLKDAIFDRVKSSEAGIPGREKAPTSLKMVMDLAYKQARLEELEYETGRVFETAARTQTVTLPRVLTQALESSDTQYRESAERFIKKIQDEAFAAQTGISSQVIFAQPQDIKRIFASPNTQSFTLNDLVLDLTLYELDVAKLTQQEVVTNGIPFIFRPLSEGSPLGQNLTQLLEAHNLSGRVNQEALRDLALSNPLFARQLHGVLLESGYESSQFYLDNFVALRHDLHTKLEMLGLGGLTFPLLSETILMHPGPLSLHHLYPNLTIADYQGLVRTYGTKPHATPASLQPTPSTQPKSWFERLRSLIFGVPTGLAGVASGASIASGAAVGIGSLFGSLRSLYETSPIGQLLGNRNIIPLTRSAIVSAVKKSLAPYTWGAIVIISVTLFILFMPYITGLEDMFNLDPFAVRSGAGARRPSYLAGGTCPIVNRPNITNGTYWNGDIYDPGHGTDEYFDDYFDGNRFSIPDSYLLNGQSCEHPTVGTVCETGFGMALDVTSLTDGANADVIIPQVCDANGVCEYNLEWTVNLVRATADGNDLGSEPDAGWGVYFTAVSNLHIWRMQLLHLDSGVTGLQPGDVLRTGQVVGNLFDRNAHLHFEIIMDGQPVDPTPFCDGSFTAPTGGTVGGERCIPPNDPTNYCDPDSPSRIREIFHEEPEFASSICMNESPLGNVAQINYGCLEDTNPPSGDARSKDYSIGLFQINILCHTPAELADSLRQITGRDTRCSDAFVLPSDVQTYCSGAGPDRCLLKSDQESQQILQACRTYFFNPANNVEYARYLYDLRGQEWGDWAGTYALCTDPQYGYNRPRGQ